MDFISFLHLMRDVIFNDVQSPKALDHGAEVLIKSTRPPVPELPPVTRGWFFPALGGYAFGQAAWLGHVANRERHARRVQERLAHLHWLAGQHPVDGRTSVHSSAVQRMGAPPPPLDLPPPRPVPVPPHTPPTTSGWWIPSTPAVTKALHAAWTFIIQPASLGALGGLGASALTNVVPDWMDSRKVAKFGLHHGQHSRHAKHAKHLDSRTSGSVYDIAGQSYDIAGAVDAGGVYDIAGQSYDIAGGADAGGIYDIAGAVNPGGVYDIAGADIVGGEYDIIGQSADIVGAWWHDFWTHHSNAFHSNRYAKRIAELLRRGDLRAHRAIVILNKRILNDGSVMAQDTIDRLRHMFRVAHRAPMPTA